MPSVIQSTYSNIKSYVCNIKAKEFIKVFDDQKSEYLFEQNVRKYLEDRSKVNKNIIESSSSNESEYFCALNNGITIICDKCNLKTLGGSAAVEMENIQIINGCQTSMSLLEANKKGSLKEDTAILLRIHETKDSNIIDKIILSTNNQNPINSRDLISNTTAQIELQKYFYDIYGLVYQRKRNDNIDIKGNTVSKKDIISNDMVGQASLACIKSAPNVALSSKGKVFTDEVSIFEQDKNRIAMATFIYQKVIEASKSEFIRDNDRLRSILKFGRFHIAEIVFKNHANQSSIEYNKMIKSNDININKDIFIAAYILYGNLKDDQKSNLLKFFKTKESVTILKNVRSSLNKIFDIYNYLIENGHINSITRFFMDNMICRIEDFEFEINIDGTISLYKKFVVSEEYKEDVEIEIEQEFSKINDIFKEIGSSISEKSEGSDRKIGIFDLDFNENILKEIMMVSIV